MTKRRSPLGTQPPVSATEPAKEASGVILIEPHAERAEREYEAAIAAHEREMIAHAERERSVIVQIEDDWLDRLDLPAD